MKKLIVVLSLLLLIGCQNTDDSAVNVNGANEGEVEESTYENEQEIEQESEQEETVLEVYQKIVDFRNDELDKDEKVQTIKGSGSQSEIIETDIAGMVLFELKSTGNSNFIVHVEDGETGDRVASLANHIGNYEGSRFIALMDGEHILQIKSNGDWEITMTQAFTQEVIDGREFTGSGDFTIGPLTTSS